MNQTRWTITRTLEPVSLKAHSNLKEIFWSIVQYNFPEYKKVAINNIDFCLQVTHFSKYCVPNERTRQSPVNWTDRGPRPVDRNGHVSASMCTLTPMLKRMLSAVVFPWVVDRQVNKTSIRMKKVGSNRICSKALLSSVHSFSKTISRVAYQSRRNQFKRCLVTDSKTQCNIPRLKWPLSPKTPMF